MVHPDVDVVGGILNPSNMHYEVLKRSKFVFISLASRGRVQGNHVKQIFEAVRRSSPGKERDTLAEFMQTCTRISSLHKAKGVLRFLAKNADEHFQAVVAIAPSVCKLEVKDGSSTIFRWPETSI